MASRPRRGKSKQTTNEKDMAVLIDMFPEMGRSVIEPVLQASGGVDSAIDQLLMMQGESIASQAEPFQPAQKNKPSAQAVPAMSEPEQGTLVDWLQKKEKEDKAKWALLEESNKREEEKLRRYHEAEQKKQEELLKKIEADRQRQVELVTKREESKRRRHEDAERKRDTLRRQQEERKKLEEQMRKLEQEREALEEEKRRLEARRKKDEEDRKLEEAKRLVAEKRREEERKRRMEEERRREEEELCRIRESEQQLSEEKRRIEEEKRAVAAEKRLLEEQMRLFEEAKRIEDERKRQAEERKQEEQRQREMEEELKRKEEERRALEEELKQKEAQIQATKRLVYDELGFVDVPQPPRVSIYVRRDPQAAGSVDSTMAEELAQIRTFLTVEKGLSEDDIHEADLTQDPELAAYLQERFGRAHPMPKGGTAAHLPLPLVVVYETVVGGVAELRRLEQEHRLDSLLAGDAAAHKSPVDIATDADTDGFETIDSDGTSQPHSADGLELGILDKGLNAAETLVSGIGSVMKLPFRMFSWFGGKASVPSGSPTMTAGDVEFEVIHTNWYWRHLKRKFRFSKDYFVRMHPQHGDVRAAHKYLSVAKVVITDKNNMIITYNDSSSPDYIRACEADIAKMAQLIHKRSGGKTVIEQLE